VVRWDGGADGEVVRDVVARREGKGRARRGRREGPNLGGEVGGGRWVWEVARRERGVARRDRDVARQGGGLPDKGGGLPDGMEWSAGRGFVGAGRDGRVSEREGRRGGCLNKGEG
jgi:hypothetical protein